MAPWADRRPEFVVAGLHPGSRAACSTIMYPHRIRLLGPWEFEPLARTIVHPDGRIESAPGPLPAPGRMRIPATWRGTPLDGFRGRVRWRRGFHAPRTLDRDERLWLVFEGVDYFADVSLNGQSLGRHEGYFERFEFDVTSLVRDRNELIVDVDCPAEADPEHQRLIRGAWQQYQPGFVGGLWGEVALEVRHRAFLRDVTVRTEFNGTNGKVIVSGRIVGELTTTLEVELSIDGSFVARAKTDAAADGAPFQIETTVPHAEPWWPATLGRPRTYDSRIELHGAARTLDTADRRLGFRSLRFDSKLADVEINGRRVPVRWHRDAGKPGVLGGESLPGTAAPSDECLVLVHEPAVVNMREFLARTDQHGVALCQDFPLRGGYSQDASFLAEAVRQARAMVRQLVHHPSIALWCCHVNPAGASDTLDAAVENAIVQLDSSRPCLTFSVAPI